MSKTVNAQVFLHIVAKIEDNVDIENFFLKDTEWIAEPKNGNGCVISITPKKIAFNGEDLNVSNKCSLPKLKNSKNTFPIIKAVKQNKDSKKWIKKFKIIKKLLLNDCNKPIFMVQYHDGSINFNVPHDDIIKKDVCIIAEHNQLEIIYGRS